MIALVCPYNMCPYNISGDTVNISRHSQHISIISTPFRESIFLIYTPLATFTLIFFW